MLKMLNGLPSPPTRDDHVLTAGTSPTCRSPSRRAPAHRVPVPGRGPSTCSTSARTSPTASARYWRTMSGGRDRRCCAPSPRWGSGIERMRPSDLSGGMKKRGARAPSPRVEVMLYDEPTTGLDPVNTARINRLITSIRDRLGLHEPSPSPDDEHRVPGVRRRIVMVGQGACSSRGRPALPGTTSGPDGARVHRRPGAAEGAWRTCPELISFPAMSLVVQVGLFVSSASSLSILTVRDGRKPPVLGHQGDLPGRRLHRRRGPQARARRSAWAASTSATRRR